MLIATNCAIALYAASRATTALPRLLDDLNLTYRSTRELVSGRRMITVNQLGPDCSWNPGTLSPPYRLVAPLVTRRRVEDERSVEIGLTEAGVRLRDQAESVPGRLCEIVRMPYDERAVLIDTLRRLTATLVEDDEHRVARAVG